MKTNVLVKIDWQQRFEHFSDFLDFRDGEVGSWLIENVRYRKYWAGHNTWGFEDEIDAVAFKLRFGL